MKNVDRTNNPMRRSLAIWLTAVVMSFLGFATKAYAEMRDRVQVSGGNVLADDGSALRGSAFFLDVFSIQDMRENERAYRDYFRSITVDYNMNLVRICPWIGNWEYMQKSGRNSEYYETHKRDYLYMIDTVVRWAEEDGIYAMVNLTTKFGTRVDLERVKDFWDVVAPRYDDKTHVLYEVINEPEIPSAKSQMRNIYRHVRGLAPSTHLVLWSPNNPSALQVDEVRSNSNGINYSNASVGFHIYEYIEGKRVQHDYATEYRAAGYPIIATEFYSLTDADYYPIDYRFLSDNISVMENRGISWVQWAPVFHYRFGNPGNSRSHSEVKFSQRYRDALQEKGVSYWARNNRPNQSPGDNAQDDSGALNLNGPKRIQDLWQRRFLHASSKSDWTVLENASGNRDWTSQQWRFLEAGNGTYRIKNVWTNDYLTPGSKNEWDTVYLAPLNTSWSSQKWRVRRVGNEVRIQNVWTGFYLSSPEGDYESVKQAGLRPAWTSQKFSILSP